MHKALHPRDDVEDYIEKCRGIQITATKNNTDNTDQILPENKNGKKNNYMDILSN